MVFVGAAILPHGAMIFDGDPNTTIPACLERNKTMPSDIISNCHKLFTACERAGDLLAQTNYDVVLLLTPHGISLSSGSLGVYMSGVARGNALWNGCFEEFELSVELDNELSEHLLEFVQKRGIDADGIITFSRMETPLRWGEVIPLWFVKNKPGVKSSKVKYVIVSVGAKSKNFEAMGRALHSFVSSLQQRIAVVVSGDLAHTHKTDCNVPLYMPDPRWSDLKPTDIADEFDKTWELWAKSIPYCDSDKSAVRSGDLGDIHPWSANQSLPWLTKVTQDDCIARSCGLRGFRILHSFLEKEIEDGGTIMPRFLARCAPTYYGMMVVFFSVSKQS